MKINRTVVISAIVIVALLIILFLIDRGAHNEGYVDPSKTINNSY